MKETSEVLDIPPVPRWDERPSRMVRIKRAANRALSLLVGGGLLIGILLLLSKDLRDEAALSSESAPLMDPFLPYYGDWEGVLRTTVAGTGEVSSTPLHISASIGAGGTLRMLIDQQLGTSEPVRITVEQTRRGGGFRRELTLPGWSEVYDGQIDATGAILWSRSLGEARSFQREWVDRDRYYIEGFSLVPGNPPQVRLISGRLDRRLRSSPAR